MKKHTEPSLTRRSFLTSIGVAGALATVGTGLVGTETTSDAAALDAGTSSPTKRRALSRKVRKDAAKIAFKRTLPAHTSNNEETDYPFVGNFSKGLPHNAIGDVDASAYQAMLLACGSGAVGDFEAIPLGGTRKLTSPQAGLAFDLEGPDSHASRCARRRASTARRTPPRWPSSTGWRSHATSRFDELRLRPDDRPRGARDCPLLRLPGPEDRRRR